MSTSNLGLLAKKLRLALTPRASLIRTTLDDGVVVEGRNASGWGGRGIYLSRDDIEPEFALLGRFLSLGDVFVDIGANTGIYSLRAAKNVGSSGAVLAFEPFPEMAAQLQKNVGLNGFDNVRLRCMCVDEFSGVAEFWSNYDKPNSFSLVKHDSNARRLNLLKMSLDDLWAFEGLSRLDYVKIDAEGAEQGILNGARRAIEKYRPIIQAEVLFGSVTVPAAGYTAYRAKLAGGQPSANLVFIPNESSCQATAQAVGWTKVSA